MDSFLRTGGENTTVFLLPGHECHKALLDEGEEESLSDMYDYFHSVFREVCPHTYILIQRNNSGTEHSATDISGEHGNGRILLDSSEPKGGTVAGLPHRAFHSCPLSVPPMTHHTSFVWKLVTDADQPRQNLRCNKIPGISYIRGNVRCSVLFVIAFNPQNDLPR